MLTQDEQSIIKEAGELWNHICEVVGDGPSRQADLREFMFHIHGIQRGIMAQSAAREHPNFYRLLGEHGVGENRVV